MHGRICEAGRRGVKLTEKTFMLGIVPVRPMLSEARFAGRRWREGAALVAVLAALAGCGKKRPMPPLPPLPGTAEVGIASWYGHPYHGRRAANGEIYDMEKFTAAHRTLPLGTWVEVVNLSNHRTVQVEITDRGPFVEGRIIDLSRAAARQIAMIGPGTARVRVTIITPPKEPPKGDLFAVQVGAFQDRANAERLREKLKERYGDCRLEVREGEPRLIRVLVGREPTIEKANGLAERLRSEVGAAFVVRLDAAGTDGL